MWSMSHDDIEALKGQYQKVSWREQSGFAPEELERRFFALSAELAKAGMPRPLIKAHCFAWIMENAQLAAEPCCLLQDHILHGNLLQKQREIWNREVMEGVLQPEAREADEAFACGFFGQEAITAIPLRIGMPSWSRGFLAFWNGCGLRKRRSAPPER